MRVLVGTALAAAAVTLAACSAGTSTVPMTASPTATAAIAASPTPSPTPTPEPTSPLTGLPQELPGQVVVVKLDNTRSAQPHAGLEAADVVYLEEVEYGITRIAAVFASTVPERVGPVRSARITDIELLAQYGRPAFVYSGAQRKLLPVIAASPLIERSPNQLASAFWRDDVRYAPYDLFVNAREVLASAPKASVEHDVGWTFDVAVPAAGRPVAKATMRWRESSATFRYDASSGTYAVSMNGEKAGVEGRDIGQRASTVVIQLVTQEPSIYFDRYGANTPFAQTVGSGKAIVLRDGFAWDVTWDRPTAESGTTWSLSDGTPLPLKPGQQWIVLLNEQTPPKLSLAKNESTSSARPSPTVSASAQ